MNLSDELKQAAQALGDTLRAHDIVRAYLTAQARLEADTEAGALERQLTALYHDLTARRQAGEALRQAEVDEFYALRGRVQKHPLVAERDAALTPLKGYIADVALELSGALGVDYTALIQAA